MMRFETLADGGTQLAPALIDSFTWTLDAQPCP